MNRMKRVALLGLVAAILPCWTVVAYGQDDASKGDANSEIGQQWLAACGARLTGRPQSLFWGVLGHSAIALTLDTCKP